MAKLNLDQFDKIEKYRNTVHEPARASYTSFIKNGQTFFQIDTYGTAERNMPDKVSQSIQFDKQMAASLIDILRKEFQLD